jgi:heme-degrading monooxygenase HmoA
VTYEIVWEFRVPPQRLADFEAAYGADGEWARLFAGADGFIEVELLKCLEQEGRYLTVDRWVSQAAFEAFRIQFSSDYKALDERLEGIAITETRIGAFAPSGGGD